MNDDIKYLWAWLLPVLFTILLLIVYAMYFYTARYVAAFKAGLVEAQCYGSTFTMWVKP